MSYRPNSLKVAYRGDYRTSFSEGLGSKLFKGGSIGERLSRGILGV